MKLQVCVSGYVVEEIPLTSTLMMDLLLEPIRKRYSAISDTWEIHLVVPSKANDVITNIE